MEDRAGEVSASRGRPEEADEVTTEGLAPQGYGELRRLAAPKK
jgi:hypothetical protein